MLALLCTLSLLSGCDLLTSRTQVESGSIQVLSAPGDALVEIDGVARGLTPCVVSGLPAGTHLLVVRKEGYRPVRRSVSLIANEASVQEVQLTKVTGMALVRSEPPGASILLDGVSVGVAPVLLRDLSMGHHTVKARLNGFEDRAQKFSVNSVEPVLVDVEMDSNAGELTVNTQPQGATVLIDGRNEGTSPVTIARVPRGERRVTLQRDGFEVWRGQVLIPAGSAEALDVTLSPLPGSLKVVSVPGKARVYVDEEFKGEAPLRLDGLKPGTYALRAELRGYETERRRVEVRHGTQLTEEFKLINNSGTLEIITEPAWVKVYVDKELVGTTRAEGTDAVSEPLRVEMLSQGPHTLQLVRKGYEFSAQRFMIRKDQITTMKEVMERQFIPNTLVRVGDQPKDVITGVLIRRHPNGDVDLEVSRGIFRTIPADRVRNLEPLKVHETLEAE